jgi:hypothetical protein
MKIRRTSLRDYIRLSAADPGVKTPGYTPGDATRRLSAGDPGVKTPGYTPGDATRRSS